MTWYRNAIGYRVVAGLHDGSRRDLTFSRRDGALDIDLAGLDVADVDRLDVGWPSAKLADLTLIDTPGLASATEGTSERTERALLDDGEGPGEADAVLYLMRHLHRSDVGFLEAFMDRSVAHASPINAIVVLSRADEIGAARPDALDSARRGRGALRLGRARARAGVRGRAGRRADRRDRRDAARDPGRLAARDRGAPRSERASACCCPSSGSATRTSTRSARRSARSCWSGSGCSGCACRSACWRTAPPGPPPTCPPRSSSGRASASSSAPSPSATGRAPRRSRHGPRWPRSGSSPRRSTGAASTARRTSSSRSTGSRRRPRSSRSFACSTSS